MGRAKNTRLRMECFQQWLAWTGIKPRETKLHKNAHESDHKLSKPNRNTTGKY